MPNNGKFLSMNTATGRIEEAAAINASAGFGDAGKIPKLDAAGKFDSTMMPAGFGSDSKAAILASEAIPAGSLVDVYNNAGTLNMRKADATAAGKEADGFVIGAIANGGTGTVYFEGTITGLTGLTPGARVYTPVGAGGVPSMAVPAASGNVVQFVGVALSATEVTFEPEDGIILA
jgi:hypothetical protein